MTSTPPTTSHSPYVSPVAAPYFHRGGPVGMLCLHGFSAVPAEVRWLAEHLAADGHTVYAPRLTGHGTDPRDMARLRWQDWYADAHDAYTVLCAQCATVFVAGLSMGGLLALLLAARVPVAGVAALAVPIFLRNRLVPYANLLKYGRPFLAMPDNTPLPAHIRAEQARRGETVVGRVHYAVWSSAAVYQLHSLGQAVNRELDRVTAPLLLMHGRNDDGVPLENQAYIAHRVSSHVIEQVIFENSGHILTQDVEAEQVFARVAAFVQQHAAQPTPIPPITEANPT